MNSNLSNSSAKIIAIINSHDPLLRAVRDCNIPGHTVMTFEDGNELFTKWKKEKTNVSLIISCGEIISDLGIVLFHELHEKGFPDIPFIIYASGATRNLKAAAVKAGIAEVFVDTPSTFDLATRISFLIEHWQVLQQQIPASNIKKYQTPGSKRVFDIVFSGLALIMLSPFFLVLAILLKLESKGPVFYYSMRVGTGYKLFKFYKFRSMYVNADQRLKDLKHLNQYNSEVQQREESKEDNGITLCEQCASKGTQCLNLIHADKTHWCEREYITYQKAANGSAFFKIKNDPRITRVGNFIRNMSIDELPQLWNVLIGDMSIVGNRPLPLYEAEKLTTDDHVLRFLAPAGMTGLWQVEKRGKGEMSEEERLMLDNVYAKNHSLLKDIRLILKTVPALFQKENV